MKEYAFTIQNFEYDGLFVKLKDGKAPYTARFINWTTDPGVARFQCSDEKIRLIPTCALMNLGEKQLPPKTWEPPKHGIIFGVPSSS